MSGFFDSHHGQEIQTSEVQDKEEITMAGFGFIMKNIKRGIILGLLIVAVWLVYPQISSFLEPPAQKVPPEKAPPVNRETGEGKPSREDSQREITDSKLEKRAAEEPPTPQSGETAQPDGAKGMETEGEKTSTESLESRAVTAQDSTGRPREEGQGSELKSEIGADRSVVSLEKKPTFQAISKEPEEKKIQPFYSKEENLWRDLLKRSMNPNYVSGYPLAKCFEKAASENDLPVALVLGLAGYFSNFDPESKMEEKFGILHIGWPVPAERLGAQDENELLDDPCKCIELSCRFLSELLSKSNRVLVPALVAYRDQQEVLRPEKMKTEDLRFSAKLRKYVENVFNGPFVRKEMYPFWRFDERSTAESFMKSVENRAGVDLWLGQDGYQYVVCFPAKDQNDRNEKAKLIQDMTGMNMK